MKTSWFILKSRPLSKNFWDFYKLRVLSSRKLMMFCRTDYECLVGICTDAINLKYWYAGRVVLVLTTTFHTKRIGHVSLKEIVSCPLFCVSLALSFSFSVSLAVSRAFSLLLFLFLSLSRSRSLFLSFSFSLSLSLSLYLSLSHFFFSLSLSLFLSLLSLSLLSLSLSFSNSLFLSPPLSLSFALSLSLSLLLLYSFSLSLWGSLSTYTSVYMYILHLPIVHPKKRNRWLWLKYEISNSKLISCGWNCILARFRVLQGSQRLCLGEDARECCMGVAPIVGIFAIDVAHEWFMSRMRKPCRVWMSPFPRIRSHVT